MDLRDKKGNKENKRDYKWLSIHSFIISTTELFALCKATADFFLKVNRQLCTEGISCWKMRSLRVIQMPQQPRIITSIKNGRFSCLLNDAITLCDYQKQESWAPAMPKIEWPMGKSKINIQEFPWYFGHRAHSRVIVKSSLSFPVNL